MRHLSHWVRDLAVALCSVMILAASPVWADDAVSAGDAAAIHQAVAGQLAAFQRDDGDKAFGYATPKIHAMFGTPDNFMLMVRNGYAPVYRPRHVAFGAVDIQEGVPTQHVLLTGPDGVEVEALYFMEHEADGSWLINGCVLRPSFQA
ncbi:MAG TPA: DUF4864 domain-containing protein [Magnetospirillaceae bacterium]|jgi:ketosteroid isomerase-like protein